MNQTEGMHRGVREKRTVGPPSQRRALSCVTDPVSLNAVARHVTPVFQVPPSRCDIGAGNANERRVP